jgi:hypothetical protein
LIIKRAVLAGISALALAGLLVPAAARAAPEDPAPIVHETGIPQSKLGPGLSSFFICAAEGGGKCLDKKLDGSTDGHVVTDPDNGSNMPWHIDFVTDVCSVIAASDPDCEPFSPGSGLNTEHDGKDIVNIFDAEQDCLHEVSGVMEWHSPGNGCKGVSGSEFVIDGWTLVNVLRSDQEAPPRDQALCSTGVAGANAYVGNWISGNCQLGSHSD